MKLHIFNPEHDIALAKNALFFTAPHAARMLRTDLGFMPMLWADAGDLVLVDDVEAAVESARHLRSRAADVVFVSEDDLRLLPLEIIEQMKVEPWGWDAALKHQLLSVNKGFVASTPTDEALQTMRQLSNRRFAAEHLLPELTSADPRFVGKSTWCDSLEQVKSLARQHGESVLKAPWSSSGRGLRYIDDVLTAHVEGWCRNVISQQGGVMVEPKYNKVADFGMEFVVTDQGQALYQGLSLFRTANGAYTGSILATEADKRAELARYVAPSLQDSLQVHLKAGLERLLAHRYVGPVGIDLMAVTQAGRLAVHPCVELNLRRTMGHVALAVSPDAYGPRALMHIDFDGHHRLRITPTGENLLNTSLI